MNYDIHVSLNPDVDDQALFDESTSTLDISCSPSLDSEERALATVGKSAFVVSQLANEARGSHEPSCDYFACPDIVFQAASVVHVRKSDASQETTRIGLLVTSRPHMSFQLPAQTETYDSYIDPDPAYWQGLRDSYCGQSMGNMRTPALVIDRAVFARNCAEMHGRAKLWDWKLRAHVGGHKTVEGTRLQLKSSADETHAVVVLTMQEAYWMRALTEDGTVKDILYGLPVDVGKLDDLTRISDDIKSDGAVLRILIDSLDHVAALGAYNLTHPRKPWSVFIKINIGTNRRAGLAPGTSQFSKLIHAVVESPAITLGGFYSHSETSYTRSSLSDASSHLTEEITAVLDAVEITHQVNADVYPPKSLPLLTLSVGSTPAADSFSPEALENLKNSLDDLGAELELHAGNGNYPMLDLQHATTSHVPLSSVSHRVLASIISTYPGQGGDGSDEAMCDAGGIAMSRELGPDTPGYGDVVRVIRPGAHAAPTVGGDNSTGLGVEETGWHIGRMSQDHGILTLKAPSPGLGSVSPASLRIGDVVEIIGQHACPIAAAHPWYYVVDSELPDEYMSGKGGNMRIVDVWIPCKGW